MDLTQRLAGKVAVITGGAGGIGLASGRRMRAEGATIVIGEIDPTAGKAAADELDGLFVPVDVSDEDAVNNLFDTGYSTFGVLGNATDVLGPTYDSRRFLGVGAPRAAWLGVDLHD